MAIVWDAAQNKYIDDGTPTVRPDGFIQDPLVNDYTIASPSYDPARMDQLAAGGVYQGQPTTPTTQLSSYLPQGGDLSAWVNGTSPGAYGGYDTYDQWLQNDLLGASQALLNQGSMAQTGQMAYDQPWQTYTTGNGYTGVANMAASGNDALVTPESQAAYQQYIKDNTIGMQVAYGNYPTALLSTMSPAAQASYNQATGTVGFPTVGTSKTTSPATAPAPAPWTPPAGTATTSGAYGSGPYTGPTAGSPIPTAPGGATTQTTGAGTPSAFSGLGGISSSSPGGAPSFSNYQTDIQQNPYLSGVADDMQRRTAQLLGENNNQIAGNSIAVGGLGGGRQGVEQGIAAGRAADTLQGNLANLYSGAWNNQANRDLSRYGLDQGMYTNQANRDLSKYGLDQNFYTAQRGQDITGAGVGANIYTQGVQGGWIPLNNAANIYGNFTGFGNNTTTQDSGGGLTGALGGALSGATLGRSMGWW